MSREPIPVAQLALQPFTTFDPLGVLLVAGDSADNANVMTISWGTFGIMWGKPVVMVMVRPTRHTWDFIAEAPDFTVNWMADDWADALKLCGTMSGRDMDKFAATGLTPVAGGAVKAPVIDQSALALECRVLYREMVKPDQFVDPSLMRLYEANDFHGLFIGEIVQAAGVEHFRVG